MRLRTRSEIAKNIIDDIHDQLPDVDTKEGTFISDVFINPTSTQIFQLYSDAKMIEYGQSILTATGIDLEKLAANFFVKKKGSTESNGKIRFYFGSTPPTEVISIPRGSVVNTAPTDNRTELYFQTDIAIEVFPNNIASYLYDGELRQYYVETEGSSLTPGTENNIRAGEISIMGEGFNENIASVTNPYAFSGGTDAEDDTSLAYRIGLAISGSNIGTRDGYTSFILKQDGVANARVVGAGEPLMKRDNGEGGMVDIYVKAQSSAEAIYNFNVDYNYITNTAERPAYANIPLPKQPVNNILSITGSRTGLDESINYLNGSDYDKEIGSDRYYYSEIEWTFDDPIEDTPQNLAIRFLNERLKEITYLQDMKFSLDWSTIRASIENDTTALPLDPYFNRGFYSDGLIYMIRSKDDNTNPYIGGRYFVKKSGKLYERVYVNPDFILIKDTSDYRGSVKSIDSIKWLDPILGSKRPIENETLVIKYDWNEKVEDLQNKVEDKRVLTADVLIKQASKVGIEIKIDVVPTSGASSTEVQSAVINKITTFINNVKELGATIDRSGLVAVVRIVPGVRSVDIENVYISRTGRGFEKELTLEGFEYFQLDNVTINMLPVDSIV